jgi:hypothetical protein
MSHITSTIVTGPTGVEAVYFGGILRATKAEPFKPGEYIPVDRVTLPKKVNRFSSLSLTSESKAQLNISNYRDLVQSR